MNMHDVNNCYVNIHDVKHSYCDIVAVYDQVSAEVQWNNSSSVLKYESVTFTLHNIVLDVIISNISFIKISAGIEQGNVQGGWGWVNELQYAYALQLQTVGQRIENNNMPIVCHKIKCLKIAAEFILNCI